MGAGQLSRLLRCRTALAHDKGVPINWTYDDVYNAYKLTAEEKMLDASHLAEWLEERKARGLPAQLHHNQAGQLERVFFILGDAVDFWAVSPNENIILYDTTANTNQAGMKLCCGTSVDENGKTRLLFVSLLVYQDKESFQLVFKRVLPALHTAPRFIFTGSDPAMAWAIQQVPSTTFHLLCTWHISKNLKTHFQVTAGRAWQAFNKAWWSICKKTESESR